MRLDINLDASIGLADNWCMFRWSVLLFLVFGLTGCAKYGEGDCVQDVKLGLIVRVVEVRFTSYKIQEWIDNKWAFFQEPPFAALDSDTVKISCPFSVETLTEVK